MYKVKREFKGAIVVTTLGKVGCGMTHLAWEYPRIIWKLQHEHK